MARISNTPSKIDGGNLQASHHLLPKILEHRFEPVLPFLEFMDFLDQPSHTYLCIALKSFSLLDDLESSIGDADALGFPDVPFLALEFLPFTSQGHVVRPNPGIKPCLGQSETISLTEDKSTNFDRLKSKGLGDTPEYLILEKRPRHS